MKNEKHLFKSIYKTLPALLILLTIYTALVPETASAQKPQPPPPGIEVTARQTDFGEKFRAGRDLIDRQEWSRATEQFREAIKKYPDDKLADAALYWLALCYKKQKKFEDADAALDRLLKEFPASPWTGDAQVMKAEIAPALDRLYESRQNNPKKNLKPVQGQVSSDLQAQIINKNVNIKGQNLSLEEKLALTDRLPLDRADEIKLAAFQSLLVADPRRAVETMGEVLKPDSKARETLKREMLRVWHNPRLFASNTLTDNIAATIGGSKEFVSLLRETLVKSFQNEKNPKIRTEIIYTLASLADAQSLDYLRQLYATENDRDIRKDIINSFGSSSSVFYPFSPDIARKPKTEPDITLEPTRKIRLDFLLEVVRAEKDAELRRLAFSNLRHFKNWSASAQAVEVMTRTL